MPVIIIAIAAVAFYVVVVYNKFVTISQSRLKNAEQEIGNQLKRQADLIPNLVSSVKGYMKHEKEIFNQITSARKTVTSALKSGSTQEIIDASAQLNQAISPIMAVFESTPELKAAEPTVKLMDELRDTADKLMYSRRTLIDLTADYNQMIVTIPSNLIAVLFGFKALPGLKMPEQGNYMEVSSSETKTPEVKL